MGRKSQFSDGQTIKTLRGLEPGAKPADVCRKIGITEATLRRWRRKFGAWT